MQLSICARRENRFFDDHSSYCYMSSAKESDVQFSNSNLNLHNNIKTLFEKLLDNESSIDTISECLIFLNNSIQSNSNILLPYLTIDIVMSIYNLSPIKPYICCSIYQFFNCLMKKYPKKFYPLFLKLNIYKSTIENIVPGIDRFSYRWILLFICETIQSIPVSIIHLIECGIIKQLNEMDPNENTDQLLIIFSNILMANEVNDYSTVSNVFNYLSAGRVTTVVNALYYIHKCLQKHENDIIWKFAIFDSRLSFLLESLGSYIVSDAIFCYTLICSYGDEPISMLISEGTILHKIISFIYDTIQNAALDQSKYYALVDSYKSSLSALDFIFSMIANAKNEENITHIYKIFIDFDFTSKIQIFNFPCKEKICQIALVLLGKINRDQAKRLFTVEFFDIIAQVMVNDDEKFEHFDLTLTISKERFAQDEEFVNLIDDIQSRYCLDF